MTLLLALGCGPAAAAATGGPAEGLAVGDGRSRHELRPRLPAFRLTDLEGRTWTRELLVGRVVLVDFWATWCPSCLAEIPLLAEVRQRFEPTDLAVLGICLDPTDRRSLAAWLRRKDVSWPQVHDRRGLSSRVAARFGVEALPTVLLFGRDGRLAAVNPRGERLLQAVTNLVGPLPATVREVR